MCIVSTDAMLENRLYLCVIDGVHGGEIDGGILISVLVLHVELNPVRSIVIENTSMHSDSVNDTLFSPILNICSVIPVASMKALCSSG